MRKPRWIELFHKSSSVRNGISKLVDSRERVYMGQMLDGNRLKISGLIYNPGVVLTTHAFHRLAIFSLVIN